ncbi:hypothetical protein GC096_16450 [Paenibacillus sp. LMG 31461]|uniref:DUF2798 domain-containing protein n=1 Tax=Paenibacillus plantarum TaxID=2654975 RepID=A0ABX1XC46_9BACL|nr:hypothetical protein [Paenibacillus plantarum]NOU65626.1 hypothetical protein [Paenibacillus plantarum]
MPTTKKEEFYFGLMMCFGMVVFMTLYNLFTHGLMGSISVREIFTQLVQIFVIATLLELFVVGPVAKKLALSIPFDKSNKVFVILFLAFFMVSGMVLCMSLYGLGNAYFSDSLHGESLFESYFTFVFKNFIFAFPLQLIIVGPLVRYAFVKVVKKRIRVTLR